MRFRTSMPLTTVALSPDGLYALSTASMGLHLSHKDFDIRLWRVSDGKMIRRFSGHQWVVTSVAFSPDGRVAISGSGDDTLKLWDIAAGKEIRTITARGRAVEEVAFLPDGRTALSGGSDGILRLWDVATGRETATFKETPVLPGYVQRISSVAVSDDGRTVLSGNNNPRASNSGIWAKERSLRPSLVIPITSIPSPCPRMAASLSQVATTRH